MVSEEQIQALKDRAQEAGIGPGSLEALILNLYGFATNSGKTVWERLDEQKLGELMAMLEARLITKKGTV